MAECEFCKREMITAESCDKNKFLYVMIEGKKHARKVHTLGNVYNEYDRCGDCGILCKEGNLHHWDCDLEECPKCGGQLITCGCRAKLTIK